MTENEPEPLWPENNLDRAALGAVCLDSVLMAGTVIAAAIKGNAAYVSENLDQLTISPDMTLGQAQALVHQYVRQVDHPGSDAPQIGNGLQALEGTTYSDQELRAVVLDASQQIRNEEAIVTESLGYFGHGATLVTGLLLLYAAIRKPWRHTIKVSE